MANEIPSEETIKKVAKVDVDDIRYIYACGVNPNHYAVSSPSLQAQEMGP